MRGRGEGRREEEVRERGGREREGRGDQLKLAVET